MRLRTIAAATLILATTASLAIACSVPVFRYALEHWQPDPYVVYVFQAGELTDDQQSIVDSMQPKNEVGDSLINVLVNVVDVNADDNAITQQIWQDHSSETLPWMVVRSPPKWGPAQTIWQGKLTAEDSAMVIDSPARSEIGKRLINGESVVWVLLECGREEEDDNAFDVLTAELRKLESEIKLPEIEEEDLDDLSVTPDALKVVFSAVRISRDDQNERALTEMLLRIEPDLLEEPQVSQPMAFPVFGRGRALYALVGKGIAPDVIEEASVFLTGGCQCTVKAQNPGVDLIMNVDWNKLVVPTETVDKDLPPLAGFSGFGRPDDTLDIKRGSESTSAAEPSKEVLPAQATVASDTAEDANPKSTHNVVDKEYIAATSGVRDTSPSDSDAGNADGDRSPSAGVGKNVLFVLMSLAVVVVFATFYFMPRAN